MPAAAGEPSAAPPASARAVPAAARARGDPGCRLGHQQANAHSFSSRLNQQSLGHSGLPPKSEPSELGGRGGQAPEEGDPRIAGRRHDTSAPGPLPPGLPPCSSVGPAVRPGAGGEIQSGEQKGQVH